MGKHAFIDVDEKFRREYTAKFLDAEIVLEGYKGAVLLHVGLPAGARRTAAAELGLRLGGVAWLRGKDFDKLIGLLKEAKREWYRAAREAKGRDKGEPAKRQRSRKVGTRAKR